MTQTDTKFTFSKPDGISDADFARMSAAMQGIAETMTSMVKANLAGSCGVRICRSRRDKTFGPVRKILEYDEV